MKFALILFQYFPYSHLKIVNYPIYMALKNLFLIGCLLIFVRGAKCPEDFIEIDDICYFKKHLDVLQDFIDENQSLYRMEPHEIGYQEWQKNRLTRGQAPEISFVK